MEATAASKSARSSVVGRRGSVYPPTAGSLLRPHIVFFGESVPMFERAAEIAQTADIMVVVGTSLAVYPAASLVRYVRPDIPIYVVDPGNPDTAGIRNPLTLIRKRAAEGMPGLAELLREKYAAG